MLAALDHNYHLHRKFLFSADGVPLLHKGYNARTKREFVRGVKEEKTYPYAEPLLALAQKFAADPSCVPQKYAEDSFDPRNIAETVRPVPGQSSVQLLQQHQSRFVSRK